MLEAVVAVQKENAEDDTMKARQEDLLQQITELRARLEPTSPWDAPANCVCAM